MESSNAWEKIEFAQKLVPELFSKEFQSISLEEERPSLKIIFHNQVKLYIKYNHFGEYSYTIIFSLEENDQMRFDNYDDFWDVKTKPHHFHIRGLTKVIESPMKGDPENDIILLKNYINF